MAGISAPQLRSPSLWNKFTYTSPYVAIASHITDIPFAFGNLTPQFVIHSNVAPGEADRQMSEVMMAYWVNFATHADPNGAGLPVWPVYSETGIIQNLGKVLCE
jgi:para-nitrobenzyl esterase